MSRRVRPLDQDFRVWCPELGDTEEEADRIEAASAEDAAERWAINWDDSDTRKDIAGEGKSYEVSVRGPDGALTRWEVQGEYTASYWAEQVLEDDLGPDDATEADTDTDTDTDAEVVP